MKPILPILIAAVFFRPFAAGAADTGFCATPEKMTATLKAEGQRSVAFAQGVHADKQPLAMMFTTNPDRSVELIGNFCVVAASHGETAYVKAAFPFKARQIFQRQEYGFR
jgi:hypothetical protein